MARSPILATVLSLFVTLAASATRVQRLTPNEIEAQASAVLVIDVLASATRAGEGGMSWIDYRVRIVEVLRGEHVSGEVLTLPFAANIAGVPRLERGAQYVIFLDDEPRRPVPAVGWEQGLFRVDLAAAEGDGHSGSCTCGGFAETPIPWEIEHLDRHDFAAAAFEEFARWNQIIDVFAPRMGDGSFGRNGVNEVVFLDRARTAALYGIQMSRFTFAVTYATPLSAAGGFDGCPVPADAVCGTFTETDVIINSEFFRGFTAFGPLDYADRGPALYGATLLHELGHTLGFHHNIGNVSVMNLYEDFAARYITAADVAEAQRAYPTRARRVTDVAAYPFSFDPERMEYAATTHVDVSPSRVSAGGTLTIRNFGVENSGTERVAGVELLIYFSRDRVLTTGDLLVGRLALDQIREPGTFFDDRGEGRTFTLPANLPDGTFYVGALVAHPGDTVTYNDAWVAPQEVTSGAASRRRSVRH